MLNSKNLRCEQASEVCMFVSKQKFAPIRNKLIYLYCRGKKVFETNIKNRFKNWYITREKSNSKVINCDYGKIYDAQNKNCRYVRAEDQCSLISACR